MNRIKNISKIISMLLLLFLMTVIFFIPACSFSGIDLRELLSDKSFAKSIVFGLKTATLSTAFSAMLGVPAGFYLSRSNSPIAFLMDAFFNIPVIIPPLIIGVMLLNFFNLPAIKNLFSFIFTFQGAVAAQFIISFPFTLKAAKNTFSIIPSIYEETAMSLGANPFRSFLDTTLRMSAGGIASGIMLSWIRSFGEFGATLLVAGGITNKTQNVPINIYIMITEGNFNKSIIASLIIIFISTIFILFLKFIFKKNIKTMF